MLGTNDLKPTLGRTAREAGRGMVGASSTSSAGTTPRSASPRCKIILVAPPAITDTDNQDMIQRCSAAA
jgi:hypothetical protein